MEAFKIYILLSVLVLIYSCNPEDLPPAQTGDPVFSISGNLVDITAGEDDFYLFTDYEKDDNDVYSFVGRIAKTSDCNVNCEEEISIKIRDVQQTSGTGGVDIDNALKVGDYSFQVMNPFSSGDLVIVNLTAEPEGTAANTYQWNITYMNDTSFVVENYNTPEVTLSFTNSINISPLDVCLNIFNNNNCQLPYCNEINLDPNTSGCQADIVVDFNPTQSFLSLEAVMQSGTAPYSYIWNTGDITAFVSEIVNGPFGGTYCVTISDATGCSNEICKSITINQGAAPIVCSSRFSYEKTIEPGGGDSLQLSTVYVEYTDSDGIVYHSDFEPQPNSSNFKILSVENYEINEKGDKTKKLQLVVDCLLFDGNGVPIHFSFEGVIAVAYP